MENLSVEMLEKLPLRELRAHLPRKCRYAKAIVEKLAAVDYEINEDHVYNVYRFNHGNHMEAIKKAMISLIMERQEKLSALV